MKSLVIEIRLFVAQLLIELKIYVLPEGHPTSANFCRNIIAFLDGEMSQ